MGRGEFMAIKHYTKVICGFPGIGKSYTFNKQDELGVKISDSDSSKFSKIKDSEGNLVQNPDFPDNYIKHIITLINEMNTHYILVSSHHDVREALANAHIPYTVIYPTKDMKDIYIQRYQDRGSPEKFIAFLTSKFDEFVEDCENDTSTAAKVIFDLPDDTLYDYIVEDIKESEKLKLTSMKTD